MPDLTLTKIKTGEMSGDLHLRPATPGGRDFFDRYYSTAVVGAVIAPTGVAAVREAATDMGLTVGEV